MTAEERLQKAYDQIDRMTEREAVLTAERDAAIARAERAETDFANTCSASRLAEARAERTRSELEADVARETARAEAAEALAASRLDVSPRDTLLLRATVPTVHLSRFSDYNICTLTGKRAALVDWMSLRAEVDAACDRMDDALRAHAAKVSQ